MKQKHILGWRHHVLPRAQGCVREVSLCVDDVDKVRGHVREQGGVVVHVVSLHLRRITRERQREFAGRR